MGTEATRPGEAVPKRKMLLLHNWKSGLEVHCDPDAIVVARRLPMLPADPPLRVKEIPERTKVVVATEGGEYDTFLVKQTPAQIGFHGGWRLALAPPGSGRPPID